MTHPDSGIVSFFGDAAVLPQAILHSHNIISILRKHTCLKSFYKRVYSTYDFMVALFDVCQRDAKLIGELKHQGR